MSKVTERILFLKFVGILKFVSFRNFLKFIKFKFSVYYGFAYPTHTLQHIQMPLLTFDFDATMVIAHGDFDSSDLIMFYKNVSTVFL